MTRRTFLRGVFKLRSDNTPSRIIFKVKAPLDGSEFKPPTRYRISGVEGLNEVTHEGPDNAGTSPDGTFPEVSTWLPGQTSKLYGIVDKKLVEIVPIAEVPQVESSVSVSAKASTTLRLNTTVNAHVSVHGWTSELAPKSVYPKVHSAVYLSGCTYTPNRRRVAPKVASEVNSPTLWVDTAAVTRVIHNIRAETPFPQGLVYTPTMTTNTPSIHASVSISGHVNTIPRSVDSIHANVGSIVGSVGIPTTTARPPQIVASVSLSAWTKDPAARFITGIDATAYISARAADLERGRIVVPGALASVFMSAYAYEPDVDPTVYDYRKHLVLFPATTGMTTYDNLVFESMVQLPDGRILAAGDGGIYEFSTSNYDAGVEIESSVGLGYTDFKLTYTKRADAMLFGYTADSPLNVMLETENKKTFYTLKESPEDWPRSGRVHPARGLIGRYWRMRIKNEHGSDFSISAIQAGMMIGKRSV